MIIETLTERGGGIGLVQLQVLAEKNWHKYFDEEKKLEKLKVGFVLKEYESATGQKARVNCLNTDYLVFQSWDDFFGKHSITDKNDWAIWKKDFADPKEAENSYTNALNALDGFPWSSELSEDDKTKISQAKNPKDIVAQQKEVAWDQFFRANGIKGDDEKRAWKETSGLKNVAEAKIAYGKGWRNLSDTSKFTEWEGRGKVKYKSNRVSTTGVDLTKHSLVEMDEYHQLFCNIHLADNLEALWALNIQGYDENQVPAICSHLVTEEKWKEKEMKLFKTAFEGDKPSGITENADFEAWLKAGLNKVKEIEDYVPGETERKIYDLGWKEPTKIINGYTKYQEEITCDKSQVKIERDNVPVWKVDKEQLKIVLGWTEEVKRKISPQDLVNFITNDFVPKISSLEDDLLPDGLKENDLVSFIGDKYRNLKFQEFKNNFRGHGDEAAGATDEEIELYFELVLDASKEPYWHLRFSEEDSARLFNNGWKDINELRGNSDTGITAEIRGKTCFNPTEKATTFDKGGKREKFEEWVWNTEFWNGDYDSLGNDETLEYRKSFLTIFLPASVARKVFNKNWDASQFDWKNGIDVIVSNYNSHGQDDINLDATVIDRKELDKVNEILFEIKEATNSNNLPSDKKIGSYDEKQVPPSKSHDRVKTLRNNRKIQLEQSTANQQARSAAIQAVNDWWNNAGMSGGVETICGNDWKKKFNNLQGADITNEENRLKNLISQAKVKPDIEAIENELNKKPLISASELQNLDYKGKMINLAAATDAQRNSKKNEIITEITQLRESKLAPVREIITNAQNVLNKDSVTKEELKKVITDLKVIASTSSDSNEQIIWEEKKAENQKLLTDLEDKLSKIIPPEPEKEGPKTPESPPPPPPPNPEPEEEEKFGEDYAELKATQQAGRRKIVENWKKEENYERSKICCYCSQEFHYDKNLEYLLAKQKAEKELSEHEAACSFKNKPEEAKNVKQNNWQKVKNTKNRYFYACRKCWGKIELDKSIADWEEAKKQGRADVAYHEEHECGNEETKKIAIYFSPNQGGNKHADLTYADKIQEDELFLEKDNQGEIYQEHEYENNKNKGTDWTPWIVGMSVILVVGVIIVWLVNKRKKVRK